MSTSQSARFLPAVVVVAFLTGCGIMPSPAAESQMPTIRIEQQTDAAEQFMVIIRSDHSSVSASIPSLKLRNTTSGEEFWSPFDDHGQPLALNGRVSLKAGVTEIGLRLSSLKWARSGAAMWPSVAFNRLVPPGEYDLVARLSPVRGASVESNIIRLGVSRSE